MTRTLGAAIGAIFVVLFFVFAITHPRGTSAAQDTSASVRP